MDRNDPELRNNLGMAYFNIGSYADAVKAYHQALDIDPNNARAHFCLGLVYLDLNDKESALGEQSKLKELNENELAFQILDKTQRQFRQLS